VRKEYDILFWGLAVKDLIKTSFLQMEVFLFEFIIPGI
jgi:hypothetical protein